MIRRMRVATAGVVIAAVGLGIGLRFRTELRSQWVIVRSMLSSTPWHDLRVCRCWGGRDRTFLRSDGLRIRASLYGLGSGKPRPGIVLVHGNTPEGRKLPMYRLLASRLAESGYVVLAPDQVGFGESESPFDSGSIEALDNTTEIESSITVLAGLPEVDSSRIAIIGHSLGAVSGLAAGIRDPRVRALVMIGPPRWMTAKFADPRTQEYWWQRYRRQTWQVYHREVPAWLTREAWLRHAAAWDVGNWLPYFSRPGHKPLLLLDGGLESESEQAWARDFFDRMVPPGKYETAAESNHYLNSVDLGFHLAVLYDERPVRATVGFIDDWLDDVFASAQGDSPPAGSVRPRIPVSGGAATD